MNLLNSAIKHEGGVGKLAQALGESQTVVSNWRLRNKIPRSWQLVLQLKYPHLQAVLDAVQQVTQPRLKAGAAL